MNMNEQMNQLGEIGSGGYSPSSDIVDQLTSKARRKRAARQGGAAGIGAVAAITLGVVGANFFINDAPEDDPAFRDRNVIENELNDSLFNRYGQYPGYTNDTKDEIEQIYEELYAAQQIQAELLEKQKAAEEAQAAEKAAKEAAEKAAKEAAEKAAAEEDSGSTPPSCDTIDKGYKYKSVDTGCEWKYRDNWYEDTISNSWEECSASGYGDSYAAGKYNCNTNSWVLNTNYFVFNSTGEIYKCIQYADAASGTASWGAWSNNNEGGGDVHGYDNKMIECSPGRTTSNSYVYVGSGAYSGGTCTGPVETKKGAPHRLSCDKDKTGGAHGTNEWYLADSNYKWFDYGWFFPGCSTEKYFHKSDTVEHEGRTFVWSDGEWVETTPA